MTNFRISLALALMITPAAAACTPKAPPLPALACTRDDIPAPVRATLREGKISWIGVHGEEHPITGAADEWRWSCLPADGRTYPVDPT
jgi:hypothetical protein